MPAIDYTVAPDATQVENWLRGMNVWPSDATQATHAATTAQINVAAAIKEFERRTGWHPFVATTEDATEVRRFSQTDPDGLLSLNTGLLELTSVAVSGTVKTVDVNYWLDPANAEQIGEPYTGILLWPAVFGPGVYASARPNQIVVTGRFGRFAEWPADAWAAVMVRGTRSTMNGINLEQDLASVSEGPFSTGFDLVGTVSLKDAWNDQKEFWENTILGYKRVIA